MATADSRNKNELENPCRAPLASGSQSSADGMKARQADVDRAESQPAYPDNASASESEHVSLPVIAETLRIDKQTVETGKVVVSVQPKQVEQAVEVALMREDITVERVPVNKVVERVLPPREEGEVTVIPVYEEVLVVEKRLVLKEEIRLTRKRTQHQEHRTERLRKEEAVISRTPLTPPPTR